MRLRVRCLMPGGYSGSRPGLRGVWPMGDIREVTTADAEYLLDTFGPLFAIEHQRAPVIVEKAPAKAQPKQRRPRKRRG